MTACTSESVPTCLADLGHPRRRQFDAAAQPWELRRVLRSLADRSRPNNGSGHDALDQRGGLGLKAKPEAERSGLVIQSDRLANFIEWRLLTWAGAGSSWCIQGHHSLAAYNPNRDRSLYSI